jgi:hypothetical protein
MLLPCAYVRETDIRDISHNRADTVGEPISILLSQLICIGISMVLCLHRSHMRGAIFDSPQLANSIRTFVAGSPESGMMYPHTVG